MKIRFKNARIYSLEKGQEIFWGEVHTENELISYVGPTIETKENFDKVIECEGNILMPGFKNAHTHSAMTFLRSYADDLPLKDWLYQAVFPFEEKLTPSDVYWLSMVAFAEYLTSGITAAFDMYYFPMAVAKAALDFGFRVVHLGTVSDRAESFAEIRQTYFDINNLSPLVSYEVGCHAEYTTGLDLLKKLSSLVNELKIPFYTHISETENEVKECIARYGKTPAQLFDSLGLWNYGGGGFHGVYLTDEDMEIFKKRDLHLVINAGSNTKLGSGIAPVDKFMAKGLNLAIGTDGPASNNCLDMFKEMLLIFSMVKAERKDPTLVDAVSLLNYATVGGSKAMRLVNNDTLKAGNKADLIMFDLSRPNMQPLNNLVKNIVYSGSKENIKLTMINGKILYQDGQFHLPIPLEKIYQKAQEITDRITRK